MKKQSRFKYGLLVVWPSLFATIAAAVVGIFTLGYYVPNWDIEVMWWLTKKTEMRS